MAEVARRLRVSANAVCTWRCRWRAEGEAGLASRGPGGSSCRLDERRLQRLVEALERGRAVHGFGEDRRWTLAGVSGLIARLFRTRYALRGVSYPLHHMRFSPQVPAHRAIGRDERAVVTWRRETWPAGKSVAAERGAWPCFEDEAGQTPRPPKTRARGRRGRTPTVAVSGKGSGRVSIVGLVCVRPGHRPRSIYRTVVHRGREGERRSFGETDHAALLDAAHQQLDGPIVLVRDDLNTHTSHAMRALIAARDWLHVIRLPPYAPELNPTEHVWSHLKRSLGNLLVHGIDHLVTIVKNRLKRIQYRPELIDAFFAHTGSDLKPEPP